MRGTMYSPTPFPLCFDRKDKAQGKCDFTVESPFRIKSKKEIMKNTKTQLEAIEKTNSERLNAAEAAFIKKCLNADTVPDALQKVSSGNVKRITSFLLDRKLDELKVAQLWEGATRFLAMPDKVKIAISNAADKARQVKIDIKECGPIGAAYQIILSSQSNLITQDKLVSQAEKWSYK